MPVTAADIEPDIGSGCQDSLVESFSDLIKWFQHLVVSLMYVTETHDFICFTMFTNFMSLPGRSCGTKCDIFVINCSEIAIRK